MALGLIEVIGLSTAMVALDEAVKNAEVTLVGYDKVIGAGKMISITLNLQGEVAAVQTAVAAGQKAGSQVGVVLSASVIPRPDIELDKLFGRYEKSFLPGSKKTAVAKKPKSKQKLNMEV